PRSSSPATRAGPSTSTWGTSRLSGGRSGCGRNGTPEPQRPLKPVGPDLAGPTSILTAEPGPPGGLNFRFRGTCAPLFPCAAPGGPPGGAVDCAGPLLTGQGRLRRRWRDRFATLDL